MLTRPVFVFVILAASSIRQSESAFDRSSCQDASVPSVAGVAVTGRADSHNKWPWLVALVKKTDEEFFCGGSLISERFILTAAHCIQNKEQQEPRKPNEVNIYLGKFNLTDKTESNAVLATPDEFIVHTDWNVGDTRWDADIAIVKLAEDVTLSDSIQPVCVWTSEMKPEKENDGGMVVGWGRTENQRLEHSDVPIEAMLLVLPISDCTERIIHHQIISERGLCVKGTGRGPCNGYSGAGFFTAQGGKSFLRGITSVSRLNAVNECDISSAEMFTNVEKFTSWIDQVLDRYEQLKCRFEKVHYPGYTCHLQNSFIRRDTEFLEVSETHVEGQKNAHVRVFVSQGNSKLKYLPIALGRLFSKLEWYTVDSSGVEEISRNNFADLPKLKLLKITEGQLTAIPVDAFHDLFKLEELWLNSNQIEAIDSSTLIQNPKLHWISLNNNRIASLDTSMFSNNLKLTYINFENNLLTSIGSELLKPLKIVYQVNFSNNKCIDREWVHFPRFSPSEKKEMVETFARQCP